LYQRRFSRRLTKVSLSLRAESGVPMQPQNDLVLWTIVTFVLFLVVLKKVAWGPLIEGLDNRESKYRKLLQDAKADRDKAVGLMADYEQKLKAAQTQVDEIIAEARRDADRTKADILATAQNDAETTRKRALDDIGRARDQAVAELFDHVRANVVTATEKVLSRSLNDADHQRLIDDALAEMSTARG
jgi:F-type H+-transporting ATPase subunit b